MEKLRSSLKGIIVSLIFLGLITLLFSALTIGGALVLHHRLLTVSLVFWGLAFFFIIGYWIADKKSISRLSNEERKALETLADMGQSYISADYFIMKNGHEVYVSLLRKGYIDYHFLKSKQEVYCRLSDKGADELRIKK